MTSTYRPTSFACGSCLQPLAFRHRGGLFAVAHYVHAATRWFRCGRRFGPNAQSRPLVTAAKLRDRWGD